MDSWDNLVSRKKKQRMYRIHFSCKGEMGILRNNASTPSRMPEASVNLLGNITLTEWSNILSSFNFLFFFGYPWSTLIIDTWTNAGLFHLSWWFQLHISWVWIETCTAIPNHFDDLLSWIDSSSPSQAFCNSLNSTLSVWERQSAGVILSQGSKLTEGSDPLVLDMYLFFTNVEACLYRLHMGICSADAGVNMSTNPETIQAESDYKGIWWSNLPS